MNGPAPAKAPEAAAAKPAAEVKPAAAAPAVRYARRALSPPQQLIKRPFPGASAAAVGSHGELSASSDAEGGAASLAGPGGFLVRSPECLLALAILFSLPACRPADPSVLYAAVEHEQYYGSLDRALSAAQRGYDAYRSERSSEWHWRFRLLLADVVLSARTPAEAIPLLEERVPSRFDRGLECRRQLFLYDAVSLSRGDSAAQPYLLEAERLAAGDPGLAMETEFRRATGPIDPRQADSRLRALLAQAETLGDSRRIAGILIDLGYLFGTSGRFDQALPFLERSRRLAESKGLRRLLSRALGSLGWCTYRLGNLDEALRLTRQADALAADTGDHRRRYRWINNLGALHFARNEFPQAAAQYRLAATLAERVQTPEWVAIALNNLTETWLQVGNLDAAEAENRKALSLIPATDPESLAFARIREARIALARRQDEDAERTLRRVLVDPSRSDRQVDWIAWFSLAGLYSRTNRPEEADAAFRSGLAAVDSEWSRLADEQYRITFLSQLADDFQEYVDFLAALGRDERALEIADSSRARVLARRFEEALPATPPLRASEMKEMARTSRTAFLYYSIAPARSHLWVVTASLITRLDLAPGSQIADLARKYSAAVIGAHDTLARDNPFAARLYEILVAPAQPLLEQAGHIIVIPDGPLHEINFETLIVPGARPHYWIEDVTLEIAPSLASLRHEARPASPSRLLLVGDPAPADPAFPSLPQLAREANAISRLFPRNVLRTGEAASPGAYRAAGPDGFTHIHFAAHAVPNKDSPLNSTIILSRNADGYKLYAKDILEVPIHARLVTLSACHAAGAKTYSGEGLMGFSWAFLRAGAQNVIASLWQVDDQAAAALMGQLYAEIARGRNPADALRLAKLGLLRSSSSLKAPYYWGAFELFTRELPH